MSREDNVYRFCKHLLKNDTGSEDVSVAIINLEISTSSKSIYKYNRFLHLFSLASKDNVFLCFEESCSIS